MMKYPIHLATLAASSLVASHAVAQIAVQDSLTTTITNGAGASISQSFNVGAGSNLLVVEYAERNGNGAGGASAVPGSLSFGSQTLTLAVSRDSLNTTQRDVAIYYLINPTIGTFNITGSTQNGNVTSFGLSVQALSGVNTAIAPITNSGEDTTNYSNTQVALNGLSAGSFAAAAGANGVASNTVLTSLTGTVSTVSATTGDGSSYNEGFVSGISAGSDSFSLTYNGAGGPTTKLPLAIPISPLMSRNPRLTLAAGWFLVSSSGASANEFCGRHGGQYARDSAADGKKCRLPDAGAALSLSHTAHHPAAE